MSRSFSMSLISPELNSDMSLRFPMEISSKGDGLRMGGRDAKNCNADERVVCVFFFV